MNCPRCSSPNYEGAKFCSNCGNTLGLPWQQPVETKDRSLTNLVILIGWSCFTSIVWLIVSKGVIPVIQKDGGSENWKMVSLIYDVMGWIFSIVTILLSLFLAITAKSKAAKIILIIFLAISVLQLIIYQVLPLFEHKNDFVYFNF